MIARRSIPDEYLAWNRNWGAPFGSRFYRFSQRVPLVRSLIRQFPRLRGYFGIERNNTTRTFEYPWAIYATPLRHGMKALDLGGGLGGFQFVLNRMGLAVTNIDPGPSVPTAWSVGTETMAVLNRAFGTEVELRCCTLREAQIPDSSFDRIFSISVLEHVPEEVIGDTMTEVARILRPGGMLVCTVDLFLDLAPFTARVTNSFGRNQDIRAMVEASGLELAQGASSELLGFPDFRAESVSARLPELLVGEKYPVLVQAFVLEKRGSPQ